jgi:hypothetical protein
MNRTLRILAWRALLAAFSIWPTFVLAYSPGCYKEVQKVCADVEPGEGRLTDCVTRNQNLFSATCRPEVHGVIEQRGRFTTHCKTYAASLCPGVKAGSGRLYACLRFHEDQLGATCKSQLQ